ncbi:MAG: ATP-binding protein [Thermoleophilia bacterium]
MRARSTEPAPAPWPPHAQVRSRAAAALGSYLLIGGFPEVQEVHPFDRVQLLQGYVETVMLKDVVERHAVTNMTAMRHLVQALVAANAGIFSVSSLYGALISQGFKVSKQTLFDYLGHLTDAYLAFLVSLRSRSEKQRLVYARKVHLVDPGLAAAMYAGGAVNKGAQLETFVYLELRRRLGPLAGGNDSSKPAEFQLIQVCANLENPATRERELGALAAAMDETGLREGVALTLAERETAEVSSGMVRVRPAWEWALEPTQSV